MEQTHFAAKLRENVAGAGRRVQRLCIRSVQAGVFANHAAAIGGLVYAGLTVHGHYVAHRRNGRQYFFDNGKLSF